MDFAPGDLHTETVSSPKGWAAVRVTHVATGIAVERERSDQLTSAVAAQRECVEELARRLDHPIPAPSVDVAPVERAEFDALLRRVEALERRLGPH